MPVLLVGLTVSDLNCLKGDAVKVLRIHRVAAIIIGLSNALIEVAYKSSQGLLTCPHGTATEYETAT